MRRFELPPRRAVVAVLLLGLLAVSTAAEVPDRMENVGNEYVSRNEYVPVAWLSEEALKRAMAEQNEPEGSRLQSVAHLFRDSGDQEVELSWSLGPNEFEIAPGGALICEPKWLSYHCGDQATDIPGLVELSRTIALVRVVDSRQGFASGSYPGELLELEVVEVLEDVKPLARELIENPPPVAPQIDCGSNRDGKIDALHYAILGPAPAIPDSFYMFDFYARMVIDGRAICLGIRQVPRGEFVLFLTITYPTLGSSESVFPLDSAALVAADGSYYGNLLDRSAADSPEELARQLEQLLATTRGEQ
ncbi:MAG: hypothetical protein GY719_20140 [bacterium]|nr:hypothetical protein [bacterium]